MSRTTLYIMKFDLTTLTPMENILYTQPNERQGYYIVCARSFGFRDLTLFCVCRIDAVRIITVPIVFCRLVFCVETTCTLLHYCCISFEFCGASAF